MITKEDARSRVQEYLREAALDENYAPVILDNQTMDVDLGWVFFYESDKYLRTGSISDSLAGNAPVVVKRADGSIIVTGTAYPLRYYLDRMYLFTASTADSFIIISNNRRWHMVVPEKDGGIGQDGPSRLRASDA